MRSSGNNVGKIKRISAVLQAVLCLILIMSMLVGCGASTEASTTDTKIETVDVSMADRQHPRRSLARIPDDGSIVRDSFFGLSCAG